MMPLFRPREYYRPKDLREAIWLLSSFGRKAKVIAGGTDLLADKPPEVECLVDISDLNLGYIRKNGDGVLEISLPQAAEVKPKKVAVSVARCKFEYWYRRDTCSLRS